VGLRLKCGQNPLVELTAEGVVIEAIKRAEDGNGIIVRLYECFGRRSHARIVPGFAHSYVYECNILEDEIQSISIADDGSIIKELNPYQILSLRFAQTGSSFDKKKTI
jgi:alpha-mannosidase